jgi:uncharacterized protein
MRWPARWRRPVRFVGDVAILALLAYAGMVAYLYAYQVELVFRPPPAGSLYMASLGLAPERLVITDDRGLATEAWRVRAPAADGTPSPYWVLFLHGNASSISWSPNLRRYHQLRQLGLNVLAVEYPGFGDVGGTASEAGMHAAARAAYEHLRRVDDIPGNRIVIYGWSLGTGAAVPLARDTDDEAALIVEGGFISVVARAREQHPFMPVAWLLQHPFRSDEAMAGTRSPTLFLHSPDDAIIPFHHGEAMFAKAAEPKRLVRLAGGHIYPNAEDADRYETAIHDFLAEVLHWTVPPTRRSAGVAVARALAGGVGPALAAWQTALAEGEPRWNLAEYELQYVARQCTLHDQHDAAIALFRANRDRFPASPLAWYELGRALDAAHHRDDARRALHRSIALEPSILNPSHDILRRLG